MSKDRVHLSSEVELPAIKMRVEKKRGFRKMNSIGGTGNVNIYGKCELSCSYSKGNTKGKD